MAQTTTQIGVPGIANRERVGEHLQQLLLDLVGVALDGKQAHWHVTGERFLQVHEQLDAIVDDARAWSDLVAERAVAIGVAVDARPGTVGSAAAVEPFPAGWLDDREVVRLMARRLETIAARLRGALDELGSLDLASQGIAIDIATGLEKHLWMLQAQLG